MIELPVIRWLAEKAKHIIRLVVYLRWASFRFWNSALDSQVVSAGMRITILVLVNLLNCFSYEFFCISACVFICLGSTLYWTWCYIFGKKKYLMIINRVASLQHFQCYLELPGEFIYIMDTVRFQNILMLLLEVCTWVSIFHLFWRLKCTDIWNLVAGKVMCGRKYSCYSYPRAFRCGSCSFGLRFGYWWIYIW